MQENLKPRTGTGSEAVYRRLVGKPPIIRHPGQEAIEISGAEATDLLHRISTNDLASSKPRTVVSTCFLTEKGRLTDVATLLIRGPDSVTVLPSPGNGAALQQWIDHFVIMEDLTLKLLQEGFSTFSLIVDTFRGLKMGSHSDLPPNNGFLEHADGTVVIRKDPADNQLLLIVPSGSENEQALLREHPITDDSREATFLRILRGTPALGNEITPAYNPYETGLQHLLNDTKGCYVGQEVIARLSTYDKVRRRLVGVLLNSYAESPQDILANGEAAGVVTSLSEVPLGDRFPGLAVVRRDLPDGEAISGTSEGGPFAGQLVAIPFPGISGASTEMNPSEGTEKQ